MSIPYDLKLRYIYNNLQLKFIEPYENVQVSFDIRNIYDYMNTIDNSDIDTYIDTSIKYNYLREIYLSETGNITDDEQQKLDDIIQSMLENKEYISCNLHIENKCKNIINAVDYIVSNDIQSINEELIIRLHEIIGKDIMENVGTYRDYNVRPKCISIFENPYYLWNTISKRIGKLIKFIDTELKKITIDEDKHSQIIQIIKLSTVLFSEFLLIHPFSDGNGRVARLLVQCIFNNIFHIPISLYTGGVLNGAREKYINVLERRDKTYRDENGLFRNKPDFLYGYFVECVHNHYANISTQICK